MKTRRITTKYIRLSAIAIALILAFAACSNPTEATLTHDHQWTGWEVVEEASIKNIGVQAQICTICGEINIDHFDYRIGSLEALKQAMEEIRNDKTGVNYALTIDGDITGIKPTLNSVSSFGSRTDITVILRGKGSLSLLASGAGAGHMFQVGNKQTLVIDSEDLTLKGRVDAVNLFSSIIGVGNGGKVLLNNGTLTGNTSECGGGVYVYNKGIFSMSGGEISGNKARLNGGGVKVQEGGIFIMSGGKISGNSANRGGGMYMEGRAGVMTASVIDGGEISGNTAINRGGGVYVEEDAYLLIANGTIYGSEASANLRNNGTSAALYMGDYRMAQYGILKGDALEIVAKRGTFTASDLKTYWTGKEYLRTTNTTLKVANGNLVK